MSTTISNFFFADNLKSFSENIEPTILSKYAVEIGVIIVVFIFTGIYKLFWEKSGKRNIPVIKWGWFRLPIVDGIYTMLSIRKAGLAIVNEYIKTYGKIVKCPIGVKYTTLIGDAEVARVRKENKILQSSEPGHMEKPHFLYDPVFYPGFLRNGIGNLDVAAWAPHRKSINMAFSYKSYRVYLKFMADAATSLCENALILCSKSKDGSVDNLKFTHIMEETVVKLNTQIIMGSECKALTKEELIDFHENFNNFKNIMRERFLSPVLLAPPVWYFSSKRKELEKSCEMAEKFSLKMIDKYKVKELDNEDDDIDNSIYDNNDDDVSGKPFRCIIEQMIKDGMTDKEISNEIGTLLTAGHETIETALRMLFYHLASNPIYQKMCRDEIDEILGPISSNSDKDLLKSVNKITMDNLKDMKYLDRFISESLRITPAIPLFGRHLKTKLKIDEDWTIEKDEVVILMPWAIHRDPKYYPNPEKFDPDRFLPENIKRRPTYSYIPFSLGTRNCVGKKMAQMELKIVMAGVIRCFELTTTDKPEDVKLTFGITLTAERMFNICFKSRIH